MPPGGTGIGAAEDKEAADSYGAIWPSAPVEKTIHTATNAHVTAAVLTSVCIRVAPVVRSKLPLLFTSLRDV